VRWPQLEAGNTRKSTYEPGKENSIVGATSMKFRASAAAGVVKPTTGPEQAGNANLIATRFILLA
jgi:hypothetical protein